MTAARARRRPAATPKPRWHGLSPAKVLLSAGALAGAIGSILALTGTIESWFRSAPVGTVSMLSIQSSMPLTYGQWRTHGHAGTQGVPPGELKLPGRLVTYNVDTSGFRMNSRLPVRLIVYDQTAQTSSMVLADPIRVAFGNDCGCADWVRIPNAAHRYSIEIAVYPPGPVRGDALRTATVGPLDASG